MKKGSTNPHLYKARVGRCVVCDEEYRAIKDCGERKQKYCSKECWSKRSPKIAARCKHCASDFKTYKSVQKIYCSADCKKADYKIRFKGENSPRWEGGKTSENRKLRASAGFKEWRGNVFSRDGYKCKLCGASKDLHPHHIIHLSEDITKALDINNGVTLCSTCHSVVHGRVIGKGNKKKFNDPKYCDVVIERWENLTGNKAELVE